MTKSKHGEIEIQTIDGKDYKVIEGDGTYSNDCCQCAFHNQFAGECSSGDGQEICPGYFRDDGLDVYFVEIKGD
ncbi:hypothetical protein [Vibrio mediterranei]|uniref:hypothetical protein n=1 Tax=Vibrio mediterranei TaxID=689 RepID=UPI0022841AFB|nr:hypothetical protein [Vibrio mediterranei]MCY9855423.1 hypothetical protein [Vibrio mediterranei]